MASLMTYAELKHLLVREGILSANVRDSDIKAVLAEQISDAAVRSKPPKFQMAWLVNYLELAPESLQSHRSSKSGRLSPSGYGRQNSRSPQRYSPNTRKPSPASIRVREAARSQASQQQPERRAGGTRDSASGQKQASSTSASAGGATAHRRKSEDPIDSSVLAWRRIIFFLRSQPENAIAIEDLFNAMDEKFVDPCLIQMMFSLNEALLNHSFPFIHE